MTRQPRLADAPDALSVKECAQLLGVSTDVVYECVHRDQIRAIRLGRRLVIPKGGLMRLLGLNGRGEESAGDAAPKEAQGGEHHERRTKK
jgi:excisionase family DNA binding protein